MCETSTIRTVGEKASDPLSTILLVVIWWVANSYYAIDAQLLLSDYGENAHFIELAVVQLSLGVLISFLCVNYMSSNKKQEKLRFRDAFFGFSLGSSHANVLLLVGFFNFIGTVLTNASYQIIGSTNTMVWKLSEPISVIALKYMFLGEKSSVTSVLGVIHIITGVVLFSWNKVNGMSASPILIANLAYPARNVTFKLFQKRRPLSSTSRFLHMQASSMPFAMFLLLAKFLFQPTILTALPRLVWNAVLFNMYQFASVVLLERFDALTHAIGNTCKRFFGILLSGLLVREAFVENQTYGLLFAIIGFILYTIGGDKLGNSHASSVRVAKLCCLVLSVMLTLRANASYQETKGPLEPLFVHVSGYRKPPKPYLPKSYAEASRMLRAQEPNFYKVAMRGMTKSENVMNKERLVLCVKSFINCYGNMQNFSKTLMIEYGGNFPLSNNIDIGDTQRIKILASQAQLFSRVALMRVGLVPTAVHWDNGLAKQVFDGGLQGLSPSEIVIPKSVIRAFKVLQDRRAAFMVNGEITQEILRLNGISKGVILVGEISFFLQKSPVLGRRWERRYNSLINLSDDKNLKIQVHLDFENSMKTLYPRNHLYREFLSRYRNAVFFLDRPEDLAALHQINVPYENIRVKGGPSSVCDMDLSIGSDIADAMEAFICKDPVPVILIPRNFQTLEVVQTLKIPYVLWDDADMLGMATKIREIVIKYKLDGSAFDRNRCLRSKEMMDAFEGYRDYIGTAVQKLSQSC